MNYKQEIVDDYISLCKSFSKDTLSRAEYRKYGKYKTSLIEKLFGTWSKFVKSIDNRITFGRHTIIKTVSENNVIISSVIDGCDINWEVFNTLKLMAEVNKASLILLWSKSLKAGSKTFTIEEYKQLEPYLATEVLFKDSSIIAQDLCISNSCKKPLTNLDKISKEYNIFIVANCKQYHEMAPNDCNTEPRQLWSTGTISIIDYNRTVSGLLNANNHTFGGLFLQYDLYTNKYLVRNLQYKNDCIEDLTTKYEYDNCSLNTSIAQAIVCGDIHFPEHDEYTLSKTIELIENLHPKMVFLHDIFSLNSINHHDLNNPLTRIIKQDENCKDLETELTLSIELLEEKLLKRFPDIMFYVVASNHDNFMIKWLNSGKYLTDQVNAIIGHEMWAKMARGKHPYEDMISCNNIIFLKQNDTLQPIPGIECANHGHIGVAGAKGSSNSFTKTYTLSITGHTHSSKISEDNVTVGTNSLYSLSYTGPIMNWSHANAVIYENSSVQLVFTD